MRVATESPPDCQYVSPFDVRDSVRYNTFETIWKGGSWLP